MNDKLAPLFRPITLGDTTFANRIAMAPMTRSKSPDGVPGPDVAAYYRRRAEGGVGLILTEGTYVDHAATRTDLNVPTFHGEEALKGWAEVVRQVHEAGGKIMPQIWHVGLVRTRVPTTDGSRAFAYYPEYGQVGPSGYVDAEECVTDPMTQADIDAAVDAFARAAVDAERLGFDGVEIHAAHGYLVDQFFWPATNRRTDGYGGSPEARGRFAGEIVAEIRKRVRPGFPILMRISQWKQQDYDARMADTPEELAALLQPSVAAGVDMFHCSQRRFWEPAFPDSPLNLAGWVRSLTGKPTMTVGSVGLDRDFLDSMVAGGASERVDLQRLLDMAAEEQFDMVAVGRALIGDPAWVNKMGEGKPELLRGFDSTLLANLD